MATCRDSVATTLCQDLQVGALSDLDLSDMSPLGSPSLGSYPGGRTCLAVQRTLRIVALHFRHRQSEVQSGRYTACCHHRQGDPVWNPTEWYSCMAGESTFSVSRTMCAAPCSYARCIALSSNALPIPRRRNPGWTPSSPTAPTRSIWSALATWSIGRNRRRPRCHPGQWQSDPAPVDRWRRSAHPYPSHARRWPRAVLDRRHAPPR